MDDDEKERARLRKAAQKAAEGVADGLTGKLYESTERHHAHLVLEELTKRYPKAECRQPGDAVEVWSDGEAR